MSDDPKRPFSPADYMAKERKREQNAVLASAIIKLIVLRILQLEPKFLTDPFIRMAVDVAAEDEITKEGFDRIVDAWRALHEVTDA